MFGGKYDWVQESQHFMFEKVNRGYELLRTVIVDYGAHSVNHAKRGIMNTLLRPDVFEVQSKVRTIQKTEFPPMTQSSLSFFDNYQILSGIPVFVLRPSDYVDQVDGMHVASSSMRSSNESSTPFDITPAQQESAESLTCSVLSADSTLFVTGHKDGTIMVWDAEHGVLKKTLSGPHDVAVADLSFYRNSSQYFMACDFSGVMSIWDVHDDERKPVVANCSRNWEKTQMPSVEGHWPQFCPNGKLLVYPVQVVVERNTDQSPGGKGTKRLFSISSMGRMEWASGGTLSRVGKHGGSYEHFCILHVFNTRADGIANDAVFGDTDGKTYSWGSHVDLSPMAKLFIPLLADSHDYALSSTEISGDSRGLLIGVSSRPDGHLIVWPDFLERPFRSYRLDGMVGCWSPCNKFIASWDSPLKNSLKTDAGSCRVWKVDTFFDTAERSSQNGDDDHPKFSCETSIVLKCPSGNCIYWCDFVSIASATRDAPQQLGVATCSVGDTVQLVLWNFEMCIPVQTFFPGIDGKDVTLHMQQPWARKWVLVKPSWGLNFIATSADRTRLGFLSASANKGIVYDTEKRIERLWISLNDSKREVDPSLSTHMDFMLSRNGDRFVTVNGDTIMVWLPHVLQRTGERGTSWVSLRSSDKDMGDGNLRCKFSRDGKSIGLMRLYGSVMDIWNLQTGQRIVLKQGDLEATATGSATGPQSLVPDEEEVFSIPGTPMSALSPTAGVAAAQKRWFCQFCISVNGDQVATCMGDMSVLSWDLTLEPPSFVQIATLQSRYCAAWAVCFVEGPTGQPDYVVVCEDTGHLVWIALHPYPRLLARKDADGRKRCTFSADGSRAVLMPDDIQVRVWDLIERQPLFSCTYRIWLGKSGQFPFPHNIALDGQTAIVGLDTARRAIKCTRDTTYDELKAMPDDEKPCLIPKNLAVKNDLTWFVTDELIPIDMDNPPKRVSSRKTNRVNSGSQTDSLLSAGSTRPGSSSTRPRQRSKLKFTDSEKGPGVGTSLDPIESMTLQEEKQQPDHYPNIKERLSSEHLWAYLRTGSSQQSTNTQDDPPGVSSEKLMIMSADSTGVTKQIFFPALAPEKFMVMSEDGTKVACMDRNKKLNVWSAHATVGCMPPSKLLLFRASSDIGILENALDEFGPGIINCQDYTGLTPLLHAVYKKDVALLKCLFAWAKRNDIKVSLRDELTDQTKGKEVLNALNLALGYRSPEVTRSIMKYLLEGVCTEVETSVILKDSLVKLSGVYPSILLRILDNKRIMLRLHELTVPEWAFAKSEYKVVASDQLIPMPARVEEMWLDERLAKPNAVFRRPVFKKTSAYACVMPYPDIAQVGMQGILRPLLFNKVPHQVFATWPIRCVIKFKWGQYGKRLIVEDCVHYLALLFFFTLYALLIGFLVDQQDSQSVHNREFYYDGTVGVLAICVFLAFGSIMRKFHQIHVLWKSGRWRGIWYWTTDYFNLLEMVCYVLIVLLVPLAHLRDVKSRLLATLVATACILLWTKTLYFAQAFKGTGPLVIMIREIVKDIRFYLFLVFAILMGFAIAFFVLFRNDRSMKCVQMTGTEPMGTTDMAAATATTSETAMGPETSTDRNTSEACESAADINQLFGSFDKTLITMFSMMLGEVGDVAELLFKVDAGLKIVGIGMYILYMLAVTIVLLNLLIAIMGNGFARVKATDMSYFLKKRAQIIDDMETGLTNYRAIEIKKKIQTYIHVLMPKHKSEIQQTGELQGKVKDAQHEFRQEILHAFQQYSEILNELKENQLRTERRIEELSASTTGLSYTAGRVISETVSMAPSRGHGGARPVQLADVSEGSDFDLFGDDSDAETV